MSNTSIKAPYDGNPKRRQRGHVLPAAPIISLATPGRLRTAHVLALCGISHSTMYVRQKEGAFPKFDGKDGPHNFWNTKTIRDFLEIPVLQRSRTQIANSDHVETFNTNFAIENSNKK